jgi:RNA polymerase sigma-70 factor (ECF subfamily)
MNQGNDMTNARVAPAEIGGYEAGSLNSSDEILLERIACRDQLAMRALYARHSTRVYRFILRIVRDRAVAEDILSDAFLDIWRQATKFEGRASASTWILAIARFKVLSHLRRRHEEQLEQEIADTIPDPAEDPEQVLQTKSRIELLRKSIAELPSAQAEVIDLVYYHDKSIAEVASITGIPEATVKTRMFYARRKLADLAKAA